jgi:triosephosphate isomerase
MNKTIPETEEYVCRLGSAPVLHDVEVFIVPPFTALDTARRMIGNAPIHLGAQNMHWDDEGAHTGEISPLMLLDCGVEIVELGHSERRADQAETDATVNAKVRSALRHGLRPLVCVGDRGDELRAGASVETVVRQVKLAFAGIDAAALDSALIAYEPVWAIGESGRVAEPAQVAEVHGAIRALLRDQGLGKIPLLYGGSVNVVNAPVLATLDDVDGLFVGRAAWTASGLVRVIEASLGAWRKRVSGQG